VYIGTSGYSYRDWVGVLYPPGMKKRDMLGYWSRWFDVLELNVTFYTYLSVKAMRAIRSKISDKRLILKLHRVFSHDRTPSNEDFEAVAVQFDEMNPDGFLLQFPFSWRYSTDAIEYLHFVRGHIPGRIFVEFRHISWARREVLKSIADMGYHIVSVDVPDIRGLFPRMLIISHRVAYVRFHGRSATGWWAGGDERYRYDYSDEELRWWGERMRGRDISEVYLLFNNHPGGGAVRSALRMREILDEVV